MAVNSDSMRRKGVRIRTWSDCLSRTDRTADRPDIEGACTLILYDSVADRRDR